MLKKLDEIDWKNLKHAYGTAEDVPTNIINLTSANKETREQAIYNLFGNIYHQGTRYEATPFAIPFLFELLQNKSVEDKDSIIVLLVEIAIGDSQDYLPDGIDVQKFKQELVDAELEMTAEQKEKSKEYGITIPALLKCYEYVENGLPIFLNCLKSPNKLERLASIFAISWFPSHKEKSVPILISHLNSLKLDQEIEIGNTIIALGILFNKKLENDLIEIVESYLDSESQFIKICSAITLTRQPIKEDLIKILKDGLEFQQLDKIAEGTMFHSGEISTYILRILEKYNNLGDLEL
jgi:hypothetical protein